MIEVLSQLISVRGAPRYLRSDNGPEFVSTALLRLARDEGIDMAIIEPGKPWQNGCTESFNGKEFNVTANQSTVRAGTEIQVKTERSEISLSLSEMAKDSWVVFELPGFASADSGKQQDSLDALRKATETSYYKAPDAVWVKLVIATAPKGMGRDQFVPSGTQASITVKR